MSYTCLLYNIIMHIRFIIVVLVLVFVTLKRIIVVTDFVIPMITKVADSIELLIGDEFNEDNFTTNFRSKNYSTRFIC